MRNIALEKIVVNVGVGRLSGMPSFEEKVLPAILRDVSVVTGQKPKTAPARKSIAGFKLREGATVGLVVTLRGARARDFLNRLIVGTFPRVKDFRGIDTKHIDAAGNLNVGVRESLAFPEINPEKSPVNFGMQITFVVRGAKSRESAIDFYRQLGVPLKVNK